MPIYCRKSEHTHVGIFVESFYRECYNGLAGRRNYSASYFNTSLNLIHFLDRVLVTTSPHSTLIALVVVFLYARCVYR
jgi:hypothetical protein